MLEVLQSLDIALSLDHQIPSHFTVPESVIHFTIPGPEAIGAINASMLIILLILTDQMIDHLINLYWLISGLIIILSIFICFNIVPKKMEKFQFFGTIFLQHMNQSHSFFYCWIGLTNVQMLMEIVSRLNLKVLLIIYNRIVTDPVQSLMSSLHCRPAKSEDFSSNRFCAS